MIRLGVLGSTKGTDLQAILDAIQAEQLNAAVSVVLSNRENAFILERAQNHNVPTSFISHQGKKREAFDAEMTKVISVASCTRAAAAGVITNACNATATSNSENSLI